MQSVSIACLDVAAIPFDIASFLLVGYAPPFQHISTEIYGVSVRYHAREHGAFEVLILDDGRASLGSLHFSNLQATRLAPGMGQ